MRFNTHRVACLGIDLLISSTVAPHEYFDQAGAQGAPRMASEPLRRARGVIRNGISAIIESICQAIGANEPKGIFESSVHRGHCRPDYKGCMAPDQAVSLGAHLRADRPGHRSEAVDL